VIDTEHITDMMLELFEEEVAHRVIAEAGQLARAYNIGNIGYRALLAEAMYRAHFAWCELSVMLAMNRKVLALAQAMQIARQPSDTFDDVGGRIGRQLRGED